MREGLMMDDYPLSLTNVVKRAEQFSGARKVVFRRPDGSVGRTTMGACIERSRRLGDRARRARHRRGRSRRDAAVEPARAPGAVLRGPVHGRGAAHAQPAPASRRAELHRQRRRGPGDRRRRVAAAGVRVVSRGARVRARDRRRATATRSSPTAIIDYESLLDGAEPMQWPADDERRAAAMCYTSGTTGRPKGVVYSHRSMVLHSLVAALPDVKSVVEARRAAAGRADVPRQRVGADLHGGAGRRGAGAARPQARRRERARPARRAST